jgi:hypothetical protein
MNVKGGMTMNALKQGGRVLALLGLSIMILIGATGTEAAMTNWTETLYTASTGELTFDWDRNSQYELAPFDPTVKEDDITQAASASLVGTVYQFMIPNFFDQLPRKTVQVTISGKSPDSIGGLSLATVLDVFGSDTPLGSQGSVYVPGFFDEGTMSPNLVTEHWHILPNPDWDVVKIWAPAVFELEAIKIQTQSVPLPASILLLGSALAGLVVLRRKRTA